MVHRPTTLQLFAAACPHALDLWEARAPYDRDVFAAGTAAHAVLEVVGLAQKKLGLVLSEAQARTLGERAVHQLVAEGRAWGGEHEPPLPPEAAEEGLALALGWLGAHDLPTTGAVELGLAFDRAWRLVPYDDEAARFRTILDRADLARVEGDEEVGEVEALIITDFKTSWADRANRLEHAQQKAQAVAAFRSGLLDQHGGETIAIRISNLRALESWTFVIPPWELDETIRRWQSEVDRRMDAADVVGAQGRPARPGLGCGRCPYPLSCEAARELAEAQELPADPMALARTFAVMQARADAVEAKLRAATQDGALDLGDGYLGVKPTTKRTPKPEATAQLVETWAAAGNDPTTLLAALGGPTIGQLDRFVRSIARTNKPRREALLAALTTKTLAPRWGLHTGPKPGALGAEEE